MLNKFVFKASKECPFDLGLKGHWFHGGKFPHYDIPVRRQSEIMNKCEVIDSRSLLKIIKRNR